MYLSYEEYRAYGGGLAEGEFALAELRARKRIDRLTDGRLGRMKTLPEEVKPAMLCAIQADGAVGAAALAERPPVTGFSTDGYSERYGGAMERIRSVEGQLDAELRRLLWGVKDDEGVPVLYRGL